MAGVSVQNSKFCKTIVSSHPSKAFSQLDMMRREGRFTDIILVADGKRFPAHRAVLCSCSPYFDRMFQPGFVEQENNEVVLKDFDADTLAVLLEFMYTAKITITEDNAQDVLMGANLMLLYDVREAAGEVLGKLIDHHNCLVIRSLASVFSCRDVEARAQNFILERFEIVSQTDEFLKLAAKEVKKFLSMDDIIVKSEESIFECILRWIRVDEENRRTHFDDLIETVRFPLVTEHYLQSEILKNEYVTNSPVCQQMIANSAIIRRNLNLSTNLGASSGSSSPPPPDFVSGLTPRLPAYRGSNMLLFLQCSNSSPWLKTPPVLFDFKKTSWSSLPGPSAPCKYREGSCYLFSDNAVFAMGGEYSVEQVEDPGPALGILPAVGLAAAPHQEIRLDRSVYAFSLEDRSWVLHSNMLTPRKRHQAVVLAGKLYVMGGYNLCSQPLDSVEFIDPSSGTGTWECLPPMLNRRVSHGAVALNGSIYVVGGWDGQGVVRSVERFSPGDKTWSQVSTYTNIRMKSGVAALDGKLYVVGGCLQTLESCYKAEVFDPITRAWSELPETKHARATPVLVPYRGKLYVFGGEGNSQGVIECYDPYTNEWTIIETRIKHFVNGAYAGCLVEKPWDWDLQQSKETTSNSNMQRVLSGIGLDVVQTVRSLWC